MARFLFRRVLGGGVIPFKASVFLGFALSFLIGFAVFANSDAKVIRSPFAHKTPCGVYLSSLRDSSTGVRVADATIESIEAYLSSKPDFAPRLIYVDKTSGKVVTDPAALRKGLEQGSVRPVVERPQLFIVGMPLWGAERSQVLNETKRILSEKYSDESVSVRTMGRPELRFKDVSQRKSGGGWWSWLKRAGRKVVASVDLAAQNVVYELPLPQFDYQRPTQGEVKTTGYKLLVSNGSQQAFLFFVKPWYIALSAGMVNTANSAATGVYEKWLANWFNRSRSETERLAKNAALSGFFSADLYWAAQPTFEKFAEIATAAGWKTFALAKWPGVVFQVGWRYFLGQSLYRWERSMEEKGQAADGRRTRNRLAFITTLITTPAFIYATVAESWFPVKIFGETVMQLNEGHFFQLFMGAVGALYYYGIPRNPKWYWSKLTLSDNKVDPKRMSWDPWVDRLDHLHSFNQRWAARLGLKWLVDKVETGVRGVFSSRRTQGEVLEGDIRHLIDLDPKLEALLAKDESLLKLIQKDPELLKLAKADPHFDEIVIRFTRKK